MAAEQIKQIYQYSTYRPYLEMRLEAMGRGARARLAEAIQTKPAFITHVQTNVVDFSPEHIIPVNNFFSHTEEEAHFFTLLVLKERAGTQALKKYYQNQIDEILEERKNYLSVISAKESLSLFDQGRYYSQWHYAAIHVLTSIPKYQTIPAIAERIALPMAIVTRALEDLVQMGLVSAKSGKYVITNKRVYLQKNSPWISLMHTHYRHRALESMNAPKVDDFHFSQSMSLSVKDYLELRKEMVRFLAELEPKIANSKEEECFMLNIDLFEMT